MVFFCCLFCLCNFFFLKGQFILFFKKLLKVKMFSFFVNKIVGVIYGDGGLTSSELDELRKDEESLRIKREKYVSDLDVEDEKKENTKTGEGDSGNEFFAKGIITSLQSDYGTLNRLHCFNVSKIAQGVQNNLYEGCIVRYIGKKIGTKNDERGGVKIIKIIEVLGDRSWDEPKPNEMELLINELQSEKPEYFNVHHRSAQGRVTQRRKGFLTVEVNARDETIDLDLVSSTFVPIIGDWLLLDCRVETNDRFTDYKGESIEIVSIRPLRSGHCKGTISKIDQDYRIGYVDRKYFFMFDALESSYLDPQIGDEVAIEFIESQPDNESYEWRCIKVTLVQLNSRALELLNKRTNEELLSLSSKKGKHGIIIDNNVSVLLFNLNEKLNFTFSVKNTSEKQHTIVKSIFKSYRKDSQLELISPKRYDRVIIESGDQMIYTIQAYAKFFGQSSEILDIRFSDGFQINQRIDINVKCSEDPNDPKRPPNSIPSIGTGSNVYKNKSYTLQVWNKHPDVIAGRKMNRKSNFVAVKFASYDVPSKLKEIVLKLVTHNEITDRLDMILTFFQGALTIQNYEQRYHHLLYLEEIQQYHNMRRYDKDRAHFKKEGEFLSLTMENIAETRPSLVLGDFVHASQPFFNNQIDNENNTRDEDDGFHNNNPSYSRNNYRNNGGGNTADDVYRGDIHKVLQNRILLKFSPSFHDKYNCEDWKLEFHFSRMSLRKQHHAIKTVVNNLGNDFLFPTKISIQSPQINISDVDGVDGVDGAFTFINNENEINKLMFYNENLNTIQKRAVVNILRGVARPMPYVIFGPPGTGKTITVIETILQISARIPYSRILVATPSNSAADLITERLIKYSNLNNSDQRNGYTQQLNPGDFVRLIGQNAFEKDQIPEHIMPFCATCDIARVDTVKNELVTLKNGLKLQLNAAQLGRHRIIIGTCGTLGTLMQLAFKPDHFTHVIIDECGQCYESEAMIPISFLNKSRGQLIIAGDPNQLDPIVLSVHARERGLDRSFLVRMLDRYPYMVDQDRFRFGYDPRLVTKLIYSYRSLPSILNLFSKLFYNNELEALVSPTGSLESELLKELSPILPNPNSQVPNHGVFFVGIRGVNQQHCDSPSWYNAAEANSVLQFFLKLCKQGMEVEDIGIITPYIAQVKEIRRLIRDLDMQEPKIGTVEEFQGQERHVIIVSTVRSHRSLMIQDNKHCLGFVKNAKRMNVAISRARSLMIIFGNPHLLCVDQNWKYLINYCVERSAYTGCDLPTSLTQNPNVN